MTGQDFLIELMFWLCNNIFFVWWNLSRSREIAFVMTSSSINDIDVSLKIAFAIAGPLNLECRSNFSYTGILSWSICAYRSRRQSAGHAGSSARQSGASRRCGGGCRQGSVQFLLGRWKLSWLFETCNGGSSDVSQRIRISRTARSFGSWCKNSILYI